MDNIKEGDEIVISIMEHHSNLVPWQKVAKSKNATLKYMYINEEYELSDEEIENKITDKTKIVSITQVSNVLGTINNVEKIIKTAHRHGAIVIVDGVTPMTISSWTKPLHYMMKKVKKVDLRVHI